MFKVDFPERRADVCIETALMERTARRTLAVHPGGALVVWSGPSRVGKTWTARWLRDSIDAAYETSPDAFRAVHYEVGQIRDCENVMKRGIRSLYHATVGRMTETAYRHASAEDLAVQLVYGLQAKNVQMVFIDEAGLLPLEAIRGMVLARDIAEIGRFPLSLIFIGMDDLPGTLRRLPQIENRIHEWCYFEAYSPGEMFELAAALHPYFASVDPSTPEGAAHVDFLNSITKGLPGKLDPFLRKLSLRETDGVGDIDLAFLKAVHLITARDEQRSIRDADTRRGAASSQPTPTLGVARAPGQKTRRISQKRVAEPPRTARGKRPRRRGPAAVPK